MTDISSDHGSVLEAGTAAITVDKDRKWSLLMPGRQPEEHMRREELLLTAMFIKGERDQEWGDDLITEVFSTRQ